MFSGERIGVMKKSFKLLMILSAVTCGLLFNEAQAAGIAYVDIPKVVNSSSQLKTLQKSHQAELKELFAFVDKARKDVAKVEDTKKKQELEEKYGKQLVDKKNKIDEAYSKKLKSVEDDISKVIEQKAKELGYDMVLSKSVVLYGTTDITDEIIKVVK